MCVSFHLCSVCVCVCVCSLACTSAYLLASLPLILLLLLLLLPLLPATVAGRDAGLLRSWSTPTLIDLNKHICVRGGCVCVRVCACVCCVWCVVHVCVRVVCMCVRVHV